MIFGVEDVDAERREKLITLLDIDLDWRLNKVSDGQRRRVQICMGLLKPYKVDQFAPEWCIGPASSPHCFTCKAIYSEASAICL